MRYVAAASLVTALVCASVAAAGQPKITYRYKIPAKAARAFNRDAHIEADSYGYPVHGCAYTHQRKMYGCAVAAPGDWQILTRTGRKFYVEWDVIDSKVTRHFRYRP